MAVRIVILSQFRAGDESGLEYSYARAFRELGHHVEQVSERGEYTYRFSKGLNQIEEWWRAKIHEKYLYETVIDADAELVVVVKGQSVSANIVRKWRLAGLRVINLFPDNPFEAAAMGLIAHQLLAQYNAMDLVLVHDRIAVGQLRERGVCSEFIAFARDPNLHNF